MQFTLIREGEIKTEDNKTVIIRNFRFGLIQQEKSDEPHPYVFVHSGKLETFQKAVIMVQINP